MNVSTLAPLYCLLHPDHVIILLEMTDIIVLFYMETNDMLKLILPLFKWIKFACGCMCKKLRGHIFGYLLGACEYFSLQIYNNLVIQRGFDSLGKIFFATNIDNPLVELVVMSGLYPGIIKGGGRGWSKSSLHVVIKPKLHFNRHNSTKILNLIRNNSIINSNNLMSYLLGAVVVVIIW